MCWSSLGSGELFWPKAILHHPWSKVLIRVIWYQGQCASDWVHLQVRPRIILKAKRSILQSWPLQTKKNLSDICQLYLNKAEIKKKKKRKESSEFLTLRIWYNSTSLCMTFGFSVVSAHQTTFTYRLCSGTAKESIHLFLAYHTRMKECYAIYMCVYNAIYAYRSFIEEESLHSKLKFLCWMEILN